VSIKLDENLPERLVSTLQALGHDVDTVRTEHLAGRDDNEVWQAAQSVNRFLIPTRDCYWCALHSLVGMLYSPAWRCCSRRSLSISGVAAWSSRPTIKCESNVLSESPLSSRLPLKER
jgi:hypothetical protein